MAKASPAAPVRRLLAAIVVAIALGTMLSLVYVTDAALSIIERLDRLPLWLNVLSLTVLVGILGGSAWLVWRLLRPPRKVAPVVPVVVDRGSVEKRLESLGSAPGTEALTAELEESDRRAALDTLYLSLFGDVSTGKSSLIRALIPQAEVRIDVRAGTTREVRHYQGDLGDGLTLMLADVPGTGEWQGESRARVAREEALRSHVVAYVCDADLTRTQDEELEWLRAFGKPLLLVLNKIDQFNPAEREAVRTSIARQAGTKPLLVSAGGNERVLVRSADGGERFEERERVPAIKPLLDALREIARRGPAAFEAQRERAVVSAVDLRLSEIEAEQRRRQAEVLVRQYARKAAVMAMAAIAPGSDLVIQGVLATRLLSELTKLYGVSLRSIDLDNFIELAGGRLRGTSALILAIAGNGLKAFPGLGTVGGGLVHAVAYAMIFDSLGRAVADTLARGEGFNPALALERFGSVMSDKRRLLDIAPQMLAIALESREQRADQDPLTTKGTADQNPFTTKGTKGT